MVYMCTPLQDGQRKQLSVDDIVRLQNIFDRLMSICEEFDERDGAEKAQKKVGWALPTVHSRKLFS